MYIYHTKAYIYMFFKSGLILKLKCCIHVFLFVEILNYLPFTFLHHHTNRSDTHFICNVCLPYTYQHHLDLTSLVCLVKCNNIRLPCTRIHLYEVGHETCSCPTSLWHKEPCSLYSIPVLNSYILFYTF